MTKISLSSCQLHVEQSGEGPPLLLVHGFPLDHTMWRHQIEAFSHTSRVIAPDLRGFGRSSVTSGAVSMEQFADDLAELIDQLAVKSPVAFCGLSMGGYVAWQFFQRHRKHLRALILCDTRAACDTAEAAAGRQATADRVVADGAEFLSELMIEKLFADGTKRERRETIDEIERVIQGTSPDGIAAALRGMASRPDMNHLLPMIDVPTLVLCGEQDQITTIEEMRSLAEQIPTARFVPIAGAGHMAPLESPDAVNTAILEFL